MGICHRQPYVRHCRHQACDQVIVIAHHCIGTDIDREYLGQEQNALFELAMAMFDTLAGVVVLAAQKVPPDTV